jgi:hypothetical protein
MRTQTVEHISRAQAEGFYANVMEKIRERRTKFTRQGKQWVVEEGESPEVAVAHTVMGMSLFDVQVVFAYLKAQSGFAAVDRLLLDALAKRLGLVIEWKRTLL